MFRRSDASVMGTPSIRARGPPMLSPLAVVGGWKSRRPHATHDLRRLGHRQSRSRHAVLLLDWLGTENRARLRTWLSGHARETVEIWARWRGAPRRRRDGATARRRRQRG